MASSGVAQERSLRTGAPWRASSAAESPSGIVPGRSGGTGPVEAGTELPALLCRRELPIGWRRPCGQAGAQPGGRREVVATRTGRSARAVRHHRRDRPPIGRRPDQLHRQHHQQQRAPHHHGELQRGGQRLHGMFAKEIHGRVEPFAERLKAWRIQTPAPPREMLRHARNQASGQVLRLLWTSPLAAGTAAAGGRIRLARTARHDSQNTT